MSLYYLVSPLVQALDQILLEKMCEINNEATLEAPLDRLDGGGHVCWEPIEPSNGNCI